MSFAFSVLGQQPEDGDGLRREGFEDRSPGGIRLQGSQPPIRTGPGTWPPGQRADRGFCLYHGVSLCRLSPVRLRAEIQADGEEMRREWRSPVWYRGVSQQRSDGDEEVIVLLVFLFVSFIFSEKGGNDYFVYLQSKRIVED